MKQMSSSELRAAIAAFGLTQKAFAEKIGLDERTVRQYLNGSPIKTPTAMLIRILVARRDRHRLIAIGYGE
jgi:transcriptional regulator with XRE-family HTH domain